MRLIDVDDAIEKIDGLCVDDNENWIGTENQSFVDHGDVIDILSSIPTVDAVEVVHGRWDIGSRAYKMLDEWDEEIFVKCNLCGREEYVPFEFEDQKMIEYAKQQYPYCHCGAKMDGGNEDGRP